ncbi:MAG: response regulator transcription factor [Anaerolineae bacterium]|nr:response regulator transcription factor [Anaerolineae bacterium]
MDKQIRVLIAHPDKTFAKKLQAFLDKEENIKAIDLARDGQGVVNLCKTALPDLVLMDLHLPVLDSVRAIQAILAQNERIRILAISSRANDRYAVEAIKAGARGCIERNGKDDFGAIATAIRQVAKGEVILNPTLASNILQEFYRISD